jgi:hypothetical protein
MATLLERALGAAQLDARIYEEVEADPNAMGEAMIVVAAASIANGIGSAGFSGPVGMIVGVVGSLVGWFLWAGLTYLIGAKLMPEPQTHANMGQLLRTLGFSAAPGVLQVAGIVPFVGWLVFFAAWVWQLAAMVVAVRQALDYRSTPRAVLVCTIGFAIYLGFYMTLLAVFVGAAIIGGALLFG